MKLKLNNAYQKKLERSKKQNKKFLENRSKKQKRVFFKHNALNGGDVDWDRTAAYSNALP